MSFLAALRFVLGLDFLKGAGTYVIGGALVLAGIAACLFLDPVTGGTLIAMGYGLIRGRVPVSELEAKIKELEAKVNAQ